MEREELMKKIIELQGQYNRLMRQYEPEFWMGLNLTIAQLKSLLFIANESEVNFRKLASGLGVTPSNVTGIVDRLVEQGLVTRTENAQDRRMLMLQLTGEGEALLSNLRERRVSHMAQILTPVKDEDLAAIVQGFTLLVKAARKY